MRLPAAVVEALNLKEGDQVEIQVAGRHAFEVGKAPGRRELVAGATTSLIDRRLRIVNPFRAG